MASHILLHEVTPAIQALFIISLSTTAVLKAWITYRQAVITEKWRTRRLKSAIKGVLPEQRSEIIYACGQLEACAPNKATPSTAPKQEHKRL